MQENMIDVSSADVKDLVRVAYDLSKPLGMGFLHAKPGGLTDEEVESLIDMNDKRCIVSMDYVHGRACKFTVFVEDGKMYIHDKWYDHTNRDLEKLLERCVFPEF